MPTVHLSPIGHSPLLSTTATLLVNGTITTKIAGTSTLQATYQDAGGASLNTNPITIGASGVPNSPIWLVAGVSYDLEFRTSGGVLVRVFEDITGVNDALAAAAAEWLPYTASAVAYVSATSFTVAGNHIAEFGVGRRVRPTLAGGKTYASVTASAYSATSGLTTVDVVNDLTALTSPITALEYSFFDPANRSIPIQSGESFYIECWATFGCQTFAGLSYTITGGVCVVTWTAHPLIVGSLVHISGSTGLVESNKVQRVTAVTTNTFSFATTATGTATIVIAGWMVQQSGFADAIRTGTGAMQFIFESAYSNTGYSIVGGSSAGDVIRLVNCAGTAAAGPSGKLTTGFNLTIWDGSLVQDLREGYIMVVGK